MAGVTLLVGHLAPIVKTMVQFVIETFDQSVRENCLILVLQCVFIFFVLEAKMKCSSY